MDDSESKGGAMATLDETNVLSLHCGRTHVAAKDEHIPNAWRLGSEMLQQLFAKSVLLQTLVTEITFQTVVAELQHIAAHLTLQRTAVKGMFPCAYCANPH